MTTKRDKKDEPKAAKRPKLKRETLKDLEAKGTEVKGGDRIQYTDASCEAGCSL